MTQIEIKELSFNKQLYRSIMPVAHGVGSPAVRTRILQFSLLPLYQHSYSAFFFREQAEISPVHITWPETERDLKSSGY